MAAPIDLATQFLGAAADDELMARSLLPIEGVTDAGVGFHCQQAIEKSLKAVLALRRVEFPYIHDLDALLEICANNEIETPDALAEVGRLSPFAARLRYGTNPSVELDRDQALSSAHSAVEWARTRIAEG